MSVIRVVVASILAVISSSHGFCDFPQGATPFVANSVCAPLADDRIQCEASVYQAITTCFWSQDNGYCTSDALVTGEDKVCPWITSPTKCAQTRFLHNRACVWYEVPTDRPSEVPSVAPSNDPTMSPSDVPTHRPSLAPTPWPTPLPTPRPTRSPTPLPTRRPIEEPTLRATRWPTMPPTSRPTVAPSSAPTLTPSQSPSHNPSSSPTRLPSASPSKHPTPYPTRFPTRAPTTKPTSSPTRQPSFEPSNARTTNPSKSPSTSPSSAPSSLPTKRPSRMPTKIPWAKPDFSGGVVSATSPDKEKKGSKGTMNLQIWIPAGVAGVAAVALLCFMFTVVNSRRNNRGVGRVKSSQFATIPPQEAAAEARTILPV